MKCTKSMLFFTVVMMMLPATSWSNTNSENLLAEYRITAGITFYSTDFDVYNEGSTSTNGTLSEDFTSAPFIILGSPYRYFGASNWGALMEYSFSGFQLNQQLVNDELVDLGTSIKGYYAYITPTLFYSFKGQQSHANPESAIITGLGLGLGYLNASGDIVFTETTQQRLDIDISGMALTVSGFVDYRTGNFMSRISVGLTSLTENELDYDSFGFAWDFGYVFEL